MAILELVDRDINAKKIDVKKKKDENIKTSKEDKTSEPTKKAKENL